MLNRLKALQLPFKTIIDGGANIGQFARAAVETFPNARVISFEPLPDIAKTLQQNLGGNSRFRVVFSALGRKAGTLKFHKNIHSHSSSALPLHENHLEAFPEARTVSTVKVSVTTLDKALRNEPLVGPVLLKLDLQGYELEALQGGIKTLRKVDAVLLETSLKPMYKGEPSFKEIETFLNGKGFRFSRSLDNLKDSRGNVLQMDALFTRKKFKK